MSETSSPVRKILIVDDNEMVRQLIALLMRREGFEPIEAADGPTALTLVEQEQPDVMIVDLLLPGLSSLEVMRRARELRPQTRIVALATTPDVKAVVDSFKHGACEFESKPFNNELLVRAVYRALLGL
jgi:two-component system response regulator (stage 0 sporulation protein F)